MHPLNRTHFNGKDNPNSLHFKFNNGTGIVIGTIVKQLGLHKYVLTTDGIDRFTCVLDQTITDSTLLQPGMMTMEVNRAVADAPITSDVGTNVNAGRTGFGLGPPQANPLSNLNTGIQVGDVFTVNGYSITVVASGATPGANEVTIDSTVTSMLGMFYTPTGVSFSMGSFGQLGSLSYYYQGPSVTFGGAMSKLGFQLGTKKALVTFSPGPTEHARSFTSKKLVTVEGNTYSWNLRNDRFTNNFAFVKN